MTAGGFDVRAYLAAEAARLDLPPLAAATLNALATYLDLLLAGNARAGLTSITDPAEAARRHLGEALALHTLLHEAGLRSPGASLVDIGSGGGLPGLPLRLLDPTLRLTLIEAHGRRAAFLEATASALALADVEVVHARAEETGRDPAHRERYDLAVARAVAPLPVLLEYAVPLLRPGGVFAAQKGSRADDELAEAAPALEELATTFEATLPLELPPEAHPQQLLILRRTGPLDARYPRRPGIPAKRPLR